MSAAFFIVGQSDRLPMMTPTLGAFVAGLRRFAEADLRAAAIAYPLKYGAANPKSQDDGPMHQ
jgi:hypothetical protein